MARSYKELTGLSKAEVIAEHDRVAANTDPPSLNYWRNELYLRELAEQNARLERLTDRLLLLTKVITFLTAVSTVAVVWAMLL